MFQVFDTLKQVDFRQLCNLYSDELLKAGKERYYHLSDNRKLLEAEQDFYHFLTEFFKDADAFYGVWSVNGVYRAALRIEPYQDGVLLSGLQTAPDSRRKGYAASLMKETLTYLSDKGVNTVYSHIHKKNTASVNAHIKCGFKKILDLAVFIDGSVDHRSGTYQIVLK